MTNQFYSLQCALARKHIPCDINRSNETHETFLIGCKAHKKRRQDVKRDYCVFGIWRHCWCGLDLKGIWKPGNQYDYILFERPTCTLEKHFTDYPCCSFYGKAQYFQRSWGDHKEWDYLHRYNATCGWHGLNYSHCRLCLQPLEGKLIGTVNGKQVHQPLNLADKILRLLKLYK